MPLFESQMTRKIGFQFNYRFLCYERSICILYTWECFNWFSCFHFTFRWKFICYSIHFCSMVQCALFTYCKLSMIKRQVSMHWLQFRIASNDKIAQMDLQLEIVWCSIFALYVFAMTWKTHVTANFAFFLELEYTINQPVTCTTNEIVPSIVPTMLLDRMSNV